MAAGDGFRQTFVVAGEAAEAGHPAEAALDDPASRQQGEAALGLGVLDDFEADAVGLGVAGRLVPGVALVDERERDGVTGDLLDGLGQFGDPDPILRVGRVTTSASRWPRVSTARRTFEPFRFLAPS